MLKELGAPSFEDFKKNREKWVGKDDDNLGQVDAGSQNINRYVQRHVYEIEGYRCETLEEVERVARNQGIPVRELDYKPEVLPQSGYKCDLLVKFVPKHVRDSRKDW